MHSASTTALSLLSLPLLALAQYTATYSPSSLPSTTEGGQYGTNACAQWGASSQESMCQNVYVNSVDDFCLWAPPWTDGTNSTIGETEAIEVSWCMKPGYGTRLIPPSTLTGAHFVQTPSYVQVTGVGDLTQLNIPAGDEGGELDPHGATGEGNPVGGLVFGMSFGGGWEQYHEWTNFMSYNQFCIRACRDGPDAPALCNHVYDLMGCNWNMPGNYDPGTFTNCAADASPPMGVYGTSTWPSPQQHEAGGVTPAAHPVPASSQCVAGSGNEAAVQESTFVITLASPSSSASSTAPTTSSVSSVSRSTSSTISSGSGSTSSTSSTAPTTSLSSGTTLSLSTSTPTALITSITSTPSSPTSTSTSPLGFIPALMTGPTSPSPTTTSNGASRSRSRPKAGGDGTAMLGVLIIAAGAVVGGMLV